MENSLSSSKPKVITVRKANYFVLVFPIGFLVITIGMSVSAFFSTPKPVVSEAQKTSVPSEDTSLLKVALFGLGEAGVLGAVVREFHRKKRLSVEDISAVAWATGLFSWELGTYLQIPFFTFLTILLWDVVAISVIVTLIQDKPFGGYSMYQNKRIIVR